MDTLDFSLSIAPRRDATPPPTGTPTVLSALSAAVVSTGHQPPGNKSGGSPAYFQEGASGYANDRMDGLSVGLPQEPFIIIIIASLERDIAPIDHDHAAQHCPTATGWMYPSASTT